MEETRVFSYRKEVRFLGRIEKFSGFNYLPFELKNLDTGRVYKGLIPLTRLPASLKEGILHIGKFSAIVPFELIENWFKGVSFNEI